MKFFKSLSLFTLWILVWACSGPSDSVDISSNFSIDTLLIDPGASIINLEENLAYSGLSMDGEKLFHFDPNSLTLQVINLENAKLEKEVVFEKEGPDGIGDWLVGFHALNDSTFALMGDNAFFLIDLEGNLKQKIRIDHLFYIQEDLVGKFTRPGFLFLGDKIIFSIDSWGGPSINLMVYDPVNDVYEIKEIPGADNILSSAYVTYINKSSFHHYYGFSLMDFLGDLIVHHRTYPEIAVYDVEEDTMQLFDPISTFYTHVPRVEKVKELNGQKESDSYKKELEKRMSFLVPLWDAERQSLYRWGYKMIPTTMDWETPEYENYLFVLDKEFKIIEEFLIPEIRSKPYRIFLVDGQLYLYQNMEDELGFLKIRLKFH